MNKLIGCLCVLFMLLGCQSMQNAMIGDQMTADNALTVELVDTFGYTLGMLAAKDPVLKEKIETYYAQIAEQGVSIAVMNEALKYLGSSDPAYRLLAYKMVRIVKLIGGDVAPDGQSILDLGPIDPELVEIGKQAYLLGLQSGGGI